MEITGKVLREVEFRDRLRGYDTDEVDEFLEKVAVAVDEMHAEITRLAARAQPALRALDESPTAVAPAAVVSAPAAPVPVAPAASMPANFDNGEIGRALILAQRAADQALADARSEAEQLLSGARQQADAMLAQANESARRLRDEAEQDVHARVSGLEADKERLEREAAALVALLDNERERLTASLQSALRFVEETLAVPGEVASVAQRARQRPALTSLPASEPERRLGTGAPAPATAPADPPSWDLNWPAKSTATSSPPPLSLPDIEAEIDEDAATAGAVDLDDDDDELHFTRADPLPPTPPLDADDSLWEEWASGSGGDAGSEPPLRFERPGGDRPAS